MTKISEPLPHFAKQNTPKSGRSFPKLKRVSQPPPKTKTMEPTVPFLNFNCFGRRAEEAWDMVLSKLPLRDDCEEATRRFGQIPFARGELLQRAHII